MHTPLILINLNCRLYKVFIVSTIYCYKYLTYEDNSLIQSYISYFFSGKTLFSLKFKIFLTSLMYNMIHNIAQIHSDMMFSYDIS